MQSRTDPQTSYLINGGDDEPFIIKSGLKTRTKVLLALLVVILAIVIGVLCYFFIFNKGVTDSSQETDIFVNTGQLSTNIPAGISKFYITDDYTGESLQIKEESILKDLNDINGVYDQKISSFQIGKGRRVQLCKNPGCLVYNSEDYIEILGPYQSGKINETDRWIRSIIQNSYDELVDPRIQLFGKSKLNPTSSSTFPYKQNCYAKNELKIFKKYQDISTIIIPPSMDVQFFKTSSCSGKPDLELAGPLIYDLTNTPQNPDQDNLGDSISSFVITLKNPLYTYVQWVKIGDDFNSQQITAYVKTGLIQFNKNQILSSGTHSYSAFEQVQYALNNQYYFMNETYNINRMPSASEIIKGDTFYKLSPEVSQDILKKFTNPITEYDKPTEVKIQDPCPPQAGMIEKAAFVLKIYGVIDTLKVLEIGTDKVQCIYTEKVNEVLKYNPKCPPDFCKKGDLRCQVCEDF
eukprot:403338454